MKHDQNQVPTISVLVATYNRADYLRLALACLLDQDFAGTWQIIVADDGSDDHTADIITAAKTESTAPEIVHCRQDHHGFRKSLILNKAVGLATGELLVFLDSDCMPERTLLSTYASHAVADAYYCGGVYKLTKAFAESVLDRNGMPDTEELLREAARTKHQLPKQKRRVLVRYWKSRLYTALNVRRPKIWGGNFAANRDVFVEVNGFDENYVGWGQEDSDLRNRFVKGGYRAVSLHTKARVYHLWHPFDKTGRIRPSGERNNRRYYKRPNVEVVCRNGLRKL